jgi:hypothetical protein
MVCSIAHGTGAAFVELNSMKLKDLIIAFPFRSV